jgi:hypothetical protein
MKYGNNHPHEATMTMDRLQELLRKEAIEIDAWRLREQGNASKGSVQTDAGYPIATRTSATNDANNYGHKRIT